MCLVINAFSHKEEDKCSESIYLRQNPGLAWLLSHPLKHDWSLKSISVLDLYPQDNFFRKLDKKRNYYIHIIICEGFWLDYTWTVIRYF